MTIVKCENSRIPEPFSAHHHEIPFLSSEARNTSEKGKAKKKVADVSGSSVRQKDDRQQNPQEIKLVFLYTYT